MNRRVLLGMTLIIVLGALTGTGFSQGLAEYSITTGSVSSATVKAGSAVNRGTKRLAGRLGENLSKSTRKVLPENKQKSERKSPAGGGTVRTLSALDKPTGSFKAIQVVCSPGDIKTSGAKSDAESIQASCLSSSKETSPDGGADLSAKTEPQDKYPSSINVSFPK
jgi:hypothetical protein